MSSVNKVLLVGNLGADPEVRKIEDGEVVANFRIATTNIWNDKSGVRQERTEWHRISVWGRQAENCGQYLKKGRKVCVEGRLRTREWADKEDGQKRYSTEILADRVTFLSGRPQEGGGGGEEEDEEP